MNKIVEEHCPESITERHC